MKRELMQQKEELLKESKAKLTTMDNIKSQIETLAKVRTSDGTPTAYSSWD
jgi:THO complex subunit 5